jgi:UDP-N-acetylglucosamine 1-carboxyvinyltransferase
VLCDPHRAVVVGKSQLRGEEVSSPDIRAGMALLQASLCASGVSTIYNVRQIDRGYEAIEKRLERLGAKIKRVFD